MSNRTKLHVHDETVMDMLFELAKVGERAANAKIASAIVLKKRVISIGKNSMKTHPFQKKYSKHEGSICIHAENDAIMKALRIIGVEDLKRSVLYVSRAKKESPKGKYILGNSKPCAGCSSAIAAFGIKKVVYVNEEGDFECL